ncbi:MAG: hypothetical protein IJZ75_01830 [Clostridia bacterium]|nr:hypothetical protein [Clostridia bacterium]
MKTAKEIVSFFDDVSERRKQEILSAPDTLCIKGTKYYVSSEAIPLGKP